MPIEETVRAVRASLSPARMGTYESATGATTDNNPKALGLYAWNAQIAAALMAPLHICEVVIRNAVSDAIEAVYGNRWPWSPVFERSLPRSSGGYDAQRDLQKARRGQPTTGKAIPELKFVFWQKMFTDRHDIRIWDSHLLRVLPNLDATKTITQLRQEIYADLERIRGLRNRIAHHEPIFRRDLADDFDKITELVELRCKTTASWMIRSQQAAAMINARP